MPPVPAAPPSLAARLFGGHPDHRLALLRAAWPHAVGAELARRTHVMEVTGASMRVRVPDAAWRKVLHSMQPTLRARLREVVGELAPSRLSFQEIPLAGSLPETAPRRRTAAADADPATLPEAVRAGAGAISDPEIRASFLLTAARALARKES